MRAISDSADATKFAAEVIRRHVPDPVCHVFLFGSRAAGSATERSDIDIGIEGPAPVPRSALARSMRSSRKRLPFTQSMSWILRRCPRISAGSRSNAFRYDQSAVAAGGCRTRHHAAG
jgi:nucleotidyltransferase-like protein